MEDCKLLLPRWVGRRVDDFVVEDRIGRGGMAVVYRAHQLSVNRYIALKIIDLSPNQDEREEFRKRFAQEAAVITLLEHIHILPIYAYGIVEEEFAYIAMRLLRGGSLADMLRDERMPIARAADIFSQVGHGLHYAHSKGIIHRDIKPSNILLDDSGNAYLSDFGLAKMIGSSLDLTRSGNLVGTPAYVAPELVRGEPADHRSDIYSLGILLYHMLTGRPPFQLSETGIAALLYKHVEEPPPPPTLLNPEISPDVEYVIMRALDKNPDQRYHSVEEMVQELNTALGRKNGIRNFITLRTPRRLNQFRPRSSKLFRRAALVLALSIMLILFVVFMINRQTMTTLQPVTMLVGESGTLADVTPSIEAIDRARQRLGEDGFIAFLACTFDSVSQVTRAREMGDMAAEMELEYRVYNADNDAYMQVTQLEQARLDGARAMILCPLDTALLETPIRSLEAAHIPVAYITLIDLPYGVKQDSSSYDIGLVVGRLAGQIYTGEKTAPANVVLLAFPGFPAADLRADGMETGFIEAVPDATIIGHYLGFTRQDAYNSMQQLIESNTNFNVILSMTDAGAYGAIEALREADYAPDSVIIASANGEAYAQELIRAGDFLRGTVAINREESSRLAIYAIVKMLAGEPVPETLTYPPGDVLTRDVLLALGAQ